DQPERDALRGGRRPGILERPRRHRERQRPRARRRRSLRGLRRIRRRARHRRHRIDRRRRRRGPRRRGEGGVLALDAGGDVRIGSVDLHGPGRFGGGGALQIDVHGAVDLGSVDLSGGYYGGYVEARVDGPVTLGNVNAVVTVGAIDDPEGGYVQIDSGATVTVAGNLRARDVASFTGDIALEGCDVMV